MEAPCTRGVRDLGERLTVLGPEALSHPDVVSCAVVNVYVVTNLALLIDVPPSPLGGWAVMGQRSWRAD